MLSEICAQVCAGPSAADLLICHNIVAYVQLKFWEQNATCSSGTNELRYSKNAANGKKAILSPACQRQSRSDSP